MDKLIIKLLNKNLEHNLTALQVELNSESEGSQEYLKLEGKVEALMEFHAELSEMIL